MNNATNTEIEMMTTFIKSGETFSDVKTGDTQTAFQHMPIDVRGENEMTYTGKLSSGRVIVVAKTSCGQTPLTNLGW